MFFYFYFQETHQLAKYVTKTVNAVFSFVIFCLFPLCPFNRMRESYLFTFYFNILLLLWGEGEAR